MNVKKDPRGLDEMLRMTSGRREVPVIVDESGKVVIGFDGGS